MKTFRGCALFIAIVSLSASSAFCQETIQVQGPDTLILLVQKLNQLYQRQQPQVTIKVHGGNVRSAVPLLLKGDVDVLQSRGVLAPDASRPDIFGVPVGAEGIVIYVHESNLLNELTIAQVRSIYTGEITNWKQLGGPDQRITLYGGESTSGVEQFFSEAVLHGAESFGYEGKTSTKELLAIVAAHPGAIGFAGFGLAPHVKPLRIRAASGSAAVEPSIANIRSLKYPISRYIYWYFAHRPQGSVKGFCTWMFSSEGQLVVEGVGFQPLDAQERLAGLQKLGLGDSAQPASARR
jgi:phosphate transport system substrate-binding protein